MNSASGYPPPTPPPPLCHICWLFYLCFQPTFQKDGCGRANNDRKATFFWLAFLCGKPSIHLPRDIPAILAKKHEGLFTIVMPTILYVYVFIKICTILRLWKWGLYIGHIFWRKTPKLNYKKPPKRLFVPKKLISILPNCVYSRVHCKGTIPKIRNKHSQKWNCTVSVPIPTFMFLFCSRKIGGPIVGKYKSLTETWMWKLGLSRAVSFLGVHKSDFLCSAVYLVRLALRQTVLNIRDCMKWSHSEKELLI